MSQPKNQKQKLLIVALLIVGLVIALISQPAPTTDVSTVPVATVPVSANGTGNVTASREAKPKVPTSRTSLEQLLEENPFGLAVLTALENEVRGNAEIMDEGRADEEPSSTIASAPLTAVYGSCRATRALIGQAIVREGDRLETGEEILKIESRSLLLGHVNE